MAAAPALTPAKVEVPRAQVGDTLLFRISATTLRPLIVHTVHEDCRVSGELFVNYEEDRTADFVLKNCFYLPSQEERTIPIRKAAAGDGIGEWQPCRGGKR